MSTTLAILDEWVSVQELAEMAGCARQTILNWNSAGITPPRYRRGRQVYYKRADVGPWLSRLLTAK